MKRYLPILVMCACALIAQAAVRNKGKTNGRSSVPPQSKARIAEIASCLPELPTAPGAGISNRKAWNKLAALETAQAFVDRANDIIKHDVPECPDNLYLEYSKTGVRRDYQIPYNVRVKNSKFLATAECIENKGRFLPKLVEYLNAICAERSWVMPAHDRDLRTYEGKEFGVDLGASERAWVCAWIVSSMKDVLPEDVVAKVKAELERRVFSTYRDCAKRTSDFAPLTWFNNPANWNAVCHAGVVRAALAVVDGRADRAMFVETAERMLPFYIAGFAADGYCSEGMGYWDFGWGHFLELALAVKDATNGKIDLFGDPKMKTIMSFGVRCQLVDGVAPDFADGGGQIEDHVLLLGQRQWPELPVTSTALDRDLLYGGPDVFTLRAFGQLDGLPAGRVDPLPMRNTFPFGQVWILRNDPKDDRHPPFSVGLKGGHNNEFHNHNDVGSYSVMFDGVPMSGDPGGTEYTEITFSEKRYSIPLISSYGHPVPVLNGCYQQAGRQYAAKNISTSFSNDVDRITMDIAGAYPKNAKVKNAIRTFLYSRKDRSFSVTDRIILKNKGKVSVPIITFGFMEAGKEKGRYRLKAEKNDVVHECDVYISVSGAEWHLSEGKRIDNPNRDAPMRYAILLHGDVAEAEIRVVFKADDPVLAVAVAADEPAPDAAEREPEVRDGLVLFDDDNGVKGTIVFGGLEERVFAREMQWYLGEITEETFRISDKEPESGPVILIKVDQGDGRVYTSKDRVCITGNGSGLSMAVTHFLEELGVRYLFPGDNGLVVPGKAKLVYPESDWREPVRAYAVKKPSPSKRELIALLKSPVPVKRGFYEWHGVDFAKMPPATADGWELYCAVKGVDRSDAASCSALLADFRRAAYGPAARIMGEYYAERAKPSPSYAALSEILKRAAIEAVHEPAISERIRAIIDSL